MKPNYELHNLFSKELLSRRKALEAKSQTKRGLSLEEDIFLREIRLMEARGWFQKPNPSKFTWQSKSRECINELKKEFMLLSKSELIEQLAIAKLRIEELEYHFENEDPELSFLRSEYEQGTNKRLRDARTKDRERKRGKAAIYVKKFEMAKAVLLEMVEVHEEITPIHSREFYKKLDKKCDEAKLARPSINSRRNYFKKLTGFKSTK